MKDSAERNKLILVVVVLVLAVLVLAWNMGWLSFGNKGGVEARPGVPPAGNAGEAGAQDGEDAPGNRRIAPE